MNINDKKVNDETVISYVTNPKKSGFKSYDRYEQYQVSTTIGQYKSMFGEDEGQIPKKYMMADLRYDQQKGFLTIED